MNSRIRSASRNLAILIINFLIKIQPENDFENGIFSN